MLLLRLITEVVPYDLWGPFARLYLPLSKLLEAVKLTLSELPQVVSWQDQPGRGREAAAASK